MVVEKFLTAKSGVFIPGTGRWLSVQQHNSFKPLIIIIVPIKCMLTNDHKTTTREMKRGSVVRVNLIQHCRSKQHLTSVTALCYEASLPVAHVRTCWITVRRSIGEAARSDLRILACRKLCEQRHCHWLMLRETSHSKLGGNTGAGSVIKIDPVGAAECDGAVSLQASACTRIYLESLDWYRGKSVIDSE